ncbi:MAG: ACT domain-containing protein [Rhodospirillales bacterium]
MADMLIITFIAEDRPGVVEILSDIVEAHGGNWLESRMAHLAETFAGVARVQVPKAKSSGLKEALAELAEDGFQVMVREAGGGEPPGGSIIDFEIVGLDHPGIVHELTRTIAALRASVEEMETWTEGAPHGGGMLFHARASVRLPDGLSEDGFRDALEDSATALVVDIVIGEA